MNANVVMARVRILGPLTMYCNSGGIPVLRMSVTSTFALAFINQRNQLLRKAQRTL
jgi:hypothetical protein